MKWQDLLPKGWRQRDGRNWSSLEHFHGSLWAFIQCGGDVSERFPEGNILIATEDDELLCTVIPEGTPLGQAVREIVTNPEGWPALLDLLLDDPEAGPHVRRLLEETQ